jgi:hypothetical protein
VPSPPAAAQAQRQRRFEAAYAAHHGPVLGRAAAVRAGRPAAPGEVLHGLSVRGLRVTQVLAMLRQRHVTVAWFDVQAAGEATNERRVPGSYFVADANPWSLGKVQLFVSKTWPPPSAPAGSPVASPSPTASG